MFQVMRWRSFWLLGLVVAWLVPVSALAQNEARQYRYDAINVEMVVQNDSTVRVQETQTYSFVGRYHKGYRSIPLRRISAITDVSVFDAASGTPLKYSAKTLDKENPASWGSYSYRKANGAMEIEWYYDAADTTRTWTITYVVHGGVSFLRDHDEFYWNLFTEYEVPVRTVQARVLIPENDFAPSQLGAYMYRSSAGEKTTTIADNRTFLFRADDAAPKEAVTIAAGWPKGLVSQTAFWKDWIRIHSVKILIGLTVFVTVLITALYWFFTERYRQGRGTIIPQYEPPQQLRPAMAEVIVKERISGKGWAATIVDLAVRGYVDIIEEEVPRWKRMMQVIWSVVAAVVVVLGTVVYTPIFILVAGVFILIIVTIKVGARGLNEMRGRRDYIIEQTRSHEADNSLEDYEKKFLDALFSQGRLFSTKEMRKHKSQARALVLRMREIEKELYKETETDTKAFAKPVSKEVYQLVIYGVVIMIFVGIIVPLGGYNDFLALILTVVACVAALTAFIKFEARLNKEGAILKEEWLGFKLYLETAERYRLQNLTPDTFEKYLPYAIIFNVEKQWGKAFEAISTSPPSWYHGAGAGGILSGRGGLGSSGFGSFSAAAFSASFSSSFSSAFASSGGGGASGGGGGAGGGGGGGGGGAS